MHIQLAVLYLLATSVVVASEGVDGCLFEPCQRHLGVYYFVIALAPNLTSYEVATLHKDGTFNTINSLASGDSLSPTPSFGPFSNVNGVWVCDGPNRINVTGSGFFYPTPIIPRNLSKGGYWLQFDGKGRVSGTGSLVNYNLASTANQDQSKWIKIFEPPAFTLEGYRLFNRCGHRGF